MPVSYVGISACLILTYSLLQLAQAEELSSKMPRQMSGLSTTDELSQDDLMTELGKPSTKDYFFGVMSIKGQGEG